MDLSHSDLQGYVKGIVEEVRRRGDEALIELTKRFDKVELTPDQLRVSSKDIQQAYEKVDPRQVEALQYVKNRIEEFERKRLERLTYIFEGEECRVFATFFPLQSVGCYVPGGRAAYPSTLLMTAVPAKVAGVPRVAVASPPTHNGDINPLTLVAADICGVDEIYRVGGAQAIAAMAYGTESISPVLKIVGPGRGFVTTTKLLVSQDVAVDIPAGPSEVLVLADEAADARLVAADMVSQAEHGEESVAVLVTTSRELAGRVSEELSRIVAEIPRGKVVANALTEKGQIIVCRDMDEAVRAVNSFAPEHVEIVCRDAESVAKRIVSAGLILLGPYTPVAASDYCIGTNHVLPTNGYGHSYSGLSALDFVRVVNIVRCGREGLRRMMEPLRILSNSEGLPNHYLAVKRRFMDE